jgi:hypothetical protein
MIPRPVWLDGEAEIIALLNAVLDRFDRQPGDERQRNVTVPAERYLPSLDRTDAQADQSWALIRELERVGVLTVRTARRNPLDPEWKGARLVFAREIDSVLREWLGRQWSEPAMQLWRRAVADHAKVFPGDPEALKKRRVVIRGRSTEEVVQAFAGIARIAGPVTLRQLSATVFWGDSKVLDARADLIGALFPGLEIKDRALVVSVYLPNTVRGTLFIENQDTYTAAANGAPAECQGLALVYAAGFRSAAGRVRSRGGALLHYAGPGVSALQSQFERWWFDSAPPPGPCWFWGDLDFAGMQILKALRNRFEALGAWRPGYDPMLATLRSHGGYGLPAARADSPAPDPAQAQTAPVEPADPAQADQGDSESAQTDPRLTGCSFADTVLLPAIRQHGQLDQEFITRAAS